jgi:hypothetical protein
MAEIMDWSDFYTENVSDGPPVGEVKNAFDAVIALWIQYSNFEISLKQFKKAVEVFDKAIIDPLGSKSVLVFQAYAKFCVDRNKLANAQNVYIKGLCAGLSDTDNATLWENFLDLMHTVNKSKKLTAKLLYDAVKKQAGVDSAALAPPPTSITSSSSAVSADINSSNSVSANSTSSSMNHGSASSKAHISLPQDAPTAAVTGADPVPSSAAVDNVSKNYPHSFDTNESKEMDTDDTEGPDPSTTQTSSASTSSTSSIVKMEAASTDVSEVPKTKEQPQVQAQQKERVYAKPDSLDDVGSMTPEQIIKTFTHRPPMIFTALHKVISFVFSSRFIHVFLFFPVIADYLCCFSSRSPLPPGFQVCCTTSRTGSLCRSWSSFWSRFLPAMLVTMIVVVVVKCHHQAGEDSCYSDFCQGARPICTCATPAGYSSSRRKRKRSQVLSRCLSRGRGQGRRRVKPRLWSREKDKGEDKDKSR